MSSCIKYLHKYPSLSFHFCCLSRCLENTNLYSREIVDCLKNVYICICELKSVYSTEKDNLQKPFLAWSVTCRNSVNSILILSGKKHREIIMAYQIWRFSGSGPLQYRVAAWQFSSPMIFVTVSENNETWGVLMVTNTIPYSTKLLNNPQLSQNCSTGSIFVLHL